VQSAECSEKMKQGEQNWIDIEQARQDGGWLKAKKMDDFGLKGQMREMVYLPFHSIQDRE
jgi:hypothetical protein